MSDEIRAAVDRIRKFEWTATFHRTIDNETASGGKVDMYLLHDSPTGEMIVGLSTPHGTIGQAVAAYVAGCCADPWFVRMRDIKDTTIPVALNHALLPFVDRQGMLDGKEVFLAAMTLMESYIADLPDRSRRELTDMAIARLAAMRDAP